MPISPARAIAFEVLMRVERDDAYAAEALRARLAPARRRTPSRGRPGREAAGERAVKREDAALATELLFGTLRWQRLLDFLIERQAGRPVAKLDGHARLALRLGAYQLLFLDRIPPFAAVNDSVELAKRPGGRQAGSLVNAVLRRLPRGPFRADSIARLLPSGAGEAERLGILGSHPTWMVERWLAALGPRRTGALLEANNRPLPLTCSVLEAEYGERVAESLREDRLEVEPGALLRSALRIRRGSVSGTAAFREGWIAVQDEASQAVAHLLGVEAGHLVLDVCAAPGNKTLLLAREAGAGGSVVASDVYRHRLRAIAAQLERTDTGNVELVALDAERPLPFAMAFDRILVDAPCSGTGTLARNPEIRWRLRREDLDDLSRRQVAILRHAADALAPGGRIVYSTCSLEPEENECVVERVLSGRSGLRPAQPPAGWEERLHPGAEPRRLIGGDGFFRTLPSESATEGFFAAILERP